MDYEKRIPAFEEFDYEKMQRSSKRIPSEYTVTCSALILNSW